MAETRTYEVLRPLDGDRAFAPGDLREMAPADAGLLLKLGAIREANQPSPKPTRPRKGA